jgi:hypothetical protein
MKFSMTVHENGDLSYRWLLNRGDRMDSFYCIWLPTDIVTTMLHYTRKVWRYQRVNHIQ